MLPWLTESKAFCMSSFTIQVPTSQSFATRTTLLRMVSSSTPCRPARDHCNLAPCCIWSPARWANSFSIVDHCNLPPCCIWSPARWANSFSIVELSVIGRVSPQLSGDCTLGSSTVSPRPASLWIAPLYSMSSSSLMITCDHCGICIMAWMASAEIPSGPQLLCLGHLAIASSSSPCVKGRQGVRLHSLASPRRMVSILLWTVLGGILAKIEAKRLLSWSCQSVLSVSESCHPRVFPRLCSPHAEVQALDLSG